MGEPKNVWDLHCELGEGPVWVDGALWFTDIKTRKVHRYDPASGGKRSWDAPEQIGFLVPEEGGALIAGLQSGLHRFTPETGAFDLLAEVEPERTIWGTTARQLPKPEQIAKQPEIGGLFEFRVGVPGVPCRKVAP